MRSIVFLIALFCFGCCNKGYAFDSEEPATIVGNVDIVSGDWCEEHQDYKMGSKNGIEVRRSYRSGSCELPDAPSGWLFNLPGLFGTPLKERENPAYRYDYDENRRLTKVSVDADTWLSIAYSGVDESGFFTCMMTASDGYKIEYGCFFNSESRNKHELLLSYVRYPDGCCWYYEYQNHPYKRTPLLTKKRGPQGRYLQIDYYDEDNVGKVRALTTSSSSDGEGVVNVILSYGADKTEITNSSGHSRCYHYNGNGKITAIEHYDKSDGKTPLLIHIDRFYWHRPAIDAVARLISKTKEDANGTVLLCRSWEYSDEGLITKSTVWGDLNGKGSKVAIGDDGYPIAIDGVESYSISYRYSSESEGANLLEKSEDNGGAVLYDYGAAGGFLRAKYICDRGAIILRQAFEYDANQNVVAVTIDDGSSSDISSMEGVSRRRKWLLEYLDKGYARGLPTLIEERGCDDSGREETVKRTAYDYNRTGYLIKKVEYDRYGGISSSVEYGYDLMGRVVTVIKSDGSIKEASYDLLGNKIKTVTLDGAGKLNQATYAYDYANRMTSAAIVDDDGFCHNEYYRYDSSHNLIAVIDGGGNATTFSYDVVGNKIGTTYPSFPDENGEMLAPSLQQKYDCCCRVIQSTDAKGFVTTFSYNSYDQPTDIVYPDGTLEQKRYYPDGMLHTHRMRDGITITYKYDGMGRLILQEKSDSAGNLLSKTTFEQGAFDLLSVNGNESSEIRYSYDFCGNLSSMVMEVEGEQRVKSFDYDFDSHKTKVVEQYGPHPLDLKVTIKEYDGMGRLLSTSIEDSESHQLRRIEENDKGRGDDKSKSIKEYTVNAFGQTVLRITSYDDDGNITETTYDTHMRLHRSYKRDAWGRRHSEVEKYYDANGNVAKETVDTANAIYSFRRLWGPLNRLEAIVEGNESVTTFTYNGRGMLASHTKPDGVVLYYDYDAGARLLRLYSSDKSIDDSYYYDRGGRVVSACDNVSGKVTTRCYDGWGQIKGETLASGYATSYLWDDLGRKSDIFLYDGSSIHYEYDAADLRSVTRYDACGKAKYRHCYVEYALTGEPLKEKMVGGTILTKSYDATGFLKAIKSSHWSQDIILDSSKKIAAIATSDVAGSWQQSFRYDSLGQLAKEECCHCSYAYDNDALCNRLSKGAQQYSYDNYLRLTSDGQYLYQYDSCGNLIGKEGPEGFWRFSYDAMNRLVKVEMVDGDITVSYGYDPFGRRISEKVEGGTEPSESYFIYDGDSEIGAVDAVGKLRHLRILGRSCSSDIGSSVALELEGSVLVPIHDWRGSLCSLEEAATQRVVEAYRYSAFGEESVFKSNGCGGKGCDEPLSPWRYCSKRSDRWSKTVFFGKRHYDPMTGRWTTADPAGRIDGVNRYAYLHNDPLSNVDIYGYCAEPLQWRKLGNNILDFFKLLAANVHSCIGDVQERYGYEQHFRTDLDNLLLNSLGRNFLLFSGYYNEDIEAGVYGQGELNDKVRITLINGIGNTRYDLKETLEMISQCHGGVNIHYIFRPTGGWTKDLIGAFTAKLGHTSSTAHLLSQRWKVLIEQMGGVGNGGLIIHYAHSIGGTDTLAAAALLTPAERKMLRIITFGTASVIEGYGFESITNYVSENDGVALLADPLHYFEAILNEQEFVVLLSDAKNIPFIDHMITQSTYRAIIELLGKQFASTL